MKVFKYEFLDTWRDTESNTIKYCEVCKQALVKFNPSYNEENAPFPVWACTGLWCRDPLEDPSFPGIYPFEVRDASKSASNS